MAVRPQKLRIMQELRKGACYIKYSDHLNDFRPLVDRGAADKLEILSWVCPLP